MHGFAQPMDASRRFLQDVSYRCCGANQAARSFFVCRDALAKMHEDLVLQAKSAITSTEDSVRWLNEERQQTEHAVRALTDAGVGHDMRPKRKLCACCPPRTFCVIQ